MVRVARNENQKSSKGIAYTFGSIPGVPLFTVWPNRKACAEANFHKPTMAGIQGTKDDGANSIVISNHYEDDQDYGSAIIYTGAGGRQKYSDEDPTKRIHFGPQIYDQTWDDWGNRALLKSKHTGKPVRVIRTSDCKSKFAPLAGLRYDGLYVVRSSWKERNERGLIICRFQLERLPGQAPIPVYGQPQPRPTLTPAPVSSSSNSAPTAASEVLPSRSSGLAAPQPSSYRDSSRRQDVSGALRASGAPRRDAERREEEGVNDAVEDAEEEDEEIFESEEEEHEPMTDGEETSRVKDEREDNRSMDIKDHNRGQIKVEDSESSAQRRKRRASSLSPVPANKVRRLTQELKRELHI